MLVVTGPEVVDDPQGRIRVRCRLQDGPGEEDLWFAVDRDHAALIADDRLDAFALIALLEAMRRGHDLELRGRLSRRLAVTMTDELQEVLCRLEPGLSKVAIGGYTPTAARPPGPIPTLATGFSGGIDSYCVLADHLLDPLTSAARLTHLTYHNVGGHAGGGARVFRERYAALTPAAAELGLPFIAVDSNVDAVVGLPYGQTHTVRNAAAALVLQAGFDRYLYASGVTYEQIRVAPSTTCATVDPILLALMGSGSLDLLSSGCRYGRIAKTLRIADFPLVQRHLDVCAWPDRSGNCSGCYKCLRAMVTLEALGRLEDFAAVFDLEKYRRLRRYYLPTLYTAPHPNDRELLDYLRRHRGGMPVSARIAGHALRLAPTGLVAALKKLVRARHPVGERITPSST